ncbi:MAG: aminopeptidase N [Desulfuromonadaceae bacterium]|nr:aminopeptidase N [Desulfuromonadaceae bacterium]MDD5105876.1 aminopeptidase N [Desulfuromonadaceae bacterium]
MTETAHRTMYRADYTPPDYIVNRVELRVELCDESTSVTSRLALRRNYEDAGGVRPLLLNGKHLNLQGLELDGVPLHPERYSMTDELLTIRDIPDRFTLEVKNELCPQDNSSLEGLYRSSGMFCTQCEAEGFRAITWFPDRPDLLTLFTTTIIADRERCPVLLSNGNLIERGELPDGRHFATWHDPFKKPSYLFALVAGDLVCIEDNFTTCSGRDVSLQIYVHHQNRGKCEHAMRSLKKAMRWDEQVYDREYDLDRYMIVAVDDFNMGAMENKGLNIFNSCYVLATPETATDDDFHAIEEVIGHEYFHNWSGNRVTCRDWFQLSLKEGLTVFRDQEFSSDMQSRGVKRIVDVRNLRTSQFPEDGGPLAHPVRPDSYMEINNFYTATVYSKGAELVRMQRTLLGSERFRTAMDLYFARFDGQAVTVDDFVQTMAEAGGIDLEQFLLWYSQAGTPELSASGSYNAADNTFILTVRQNCPATPGQPDKQPLHIPLALGLLGQDGAELPVTLAGEAPGTGTSRILHLHAAVETFRFTGLTKEPVPALLRGFSAPVKLDYPYRYDQLALLMAHEPDPFCRWEAGQQMAIGLILGMVDNYKNGRELSLDLQFTEAFRANLLSEVADYAFLAETLTLPSEKYLAELVQEIDPAAIHAARQFVIRTLADCCRNEFIELRSSVRKVVPYSPDDGRSGERRLANLCLAYLMSSGGQENIDRCFDQYRSSDNMTDAMAALSSLVSCDCPERCELLDDFYRRWQGDRLVVDKWFSLQATSILPGTLREVHALLDHPAFELSNPNRFRSLVGAFSQRNQVHFHDPTGAGYRFLTDQLLRLIPVNPQVTARMLGPLTTWQRFEAGRSALMREQLLRIQAVDGLPRDVYEVVGKSLKES